MNRIEHFNHQLNSSLQNSDIEDMKRFKNQIDITLRSVMRTQTNKTKAGIIGAGKCRDFSLPIFLEECRLVVLTDIDLQSMKEAVGQKSSVQFRQVEYTGFESRSFFDDFKERLINAKDFVKIEQILTHKMDAVKTYQFMADEFQTFDILYVSPIYSQLIYQQVLLECSILRERGYPEYLLKHIEGFMLDQMIPIINRFNSNLESLLKDNGTLIVASDIFELDHGSRFHTRVVNGIQNRGVMDEIYQSYATKYGMGLGDYGLYNLDEKMQEVRSKWLLWPFAKDRSYAVKLKVYKKIRNEGGTQ